MVALRKESVDRNNISTNYHIRICKSLSARRAWIEIGNNLSMLCSAGSLSARRAWIEITVVGVLATLVTVALRKESVDRNLLGGRCDSVFERSLSARRAWIEIYNLSDIDDKFNVALRKESVDRNKTFIVLPKQLDSRSPQGERG